MLTDSVQSQPLRQQNKKRHKQNKLLGQRYDGAFPRFPGGENVEHFNYYIIAKTNDNKAYCINKCKNETGNPEWSLYCVNIYMNYLRAYINKDIPSLPSIHDLYILIASTSSCFEPKDILTPKYLNRLKEYLSKANFSESINSIIDVLKSPNFDYHIIQ